MTLKIDIFTRNMELTDRVKEYVYKKISKLDRFLSDIDETRLDLVATKTARSASDRQVAQITIRGKGYILRTEERADDIFAAVDAAVDKMQRQIERFKGKRTHGRKDISPAAEAAAALSPVDDEEKDETPIIGRRKHFVLVPMNEEEALDHMKLLGHENFFIFYNANTSSINVLYHRRDGTYGIIEPEVG